METIEEYRHVLTKELQDLFISILKKCSQKIEKEHIGFIGVIENKKGFPHDIDVLIFPSKNSRIGESVIELTKLYREIQKELKKRNERLYLAVSPRKDMQEMVYYLASLQEGGAGIIPVHSLFFPDYPSFKNFSPAGFIKSINKKMITIYGHYDAIKEAPKINQKLLDPYFYIINFELPLKIDTFPHHLVRSSAQSLFDYMEKKYNLKPSKKTFHSLNEIENELFRMLRELDKRTYNL